MTFPPYWMTLRRSGTDLIEVVSDTGPLISLERVRAGFDLLRNALIEHLIPL
jgi:hypothetical protein